MAPRAKRIIDPSEQPMRADLFDELFTPKRGSPLEIQAYSQSSSKPAILGNTFQVTFPTTLQDPAPGPWLPDQGDDGLWTFSLQASGLPVNRGSGLDNPVIVALIYYGQGQANFVKGPIILRNGSLQKVKINCRSAQVAFYTAGTARRTGFVVNVNASITKGSNTGADGYSWSWIDPLVNVVGGQVNVAAAPVVNGVIGSWGAVLSAAGTNPNLWLLFFDIAAGPPAGGLSPIPGGRSMSKMSAVGDWVAFDDQLAPGGIGYQFGLYATLSSTPGTFTAPTGAPTMVLDCKVGT